MPFTIAKQSSTNMAAIMMTVAFFVANAAAQPVPNLVGQFQKLAHHGDPLGFHLGVGTDADVCRHWQGIARYDGPDGTPYLLVTKSGNRTDYLLCALEGWCGASNCPGDMLIVEMGSRDKDRERLRSNRLKRGATFENTVPPNNDRGVALVVFDGGEFPAYYHPGGLQVVGDVAVVALERPINATDGHQGALCFIDISDPLNPVHLKTLDYFGFKIGVVGAVRQPDGKYLFLLSGEDNSVMGFWRSTTSDLTDPNLDVTFVNTVGPPGPSDKWLAWQTMNLFYGDDGLIYAACAGNDGFAGTGADWIRLYRITGSPGTSFQMQYVAERHLYFNEPSLGAAEAAPGFHVTDSGQLIFYCAEHDNDGPGGTVKMGEWRNYDMTNDRSVDSCGGWVEFYEDSNGWSDSSPDRSIVWDFADRELEDWDNLSNMGWNDDIDSVRWNLPPGLEVRLYRHAYFDTTAIVLTGSGSLGDLGSDGDVISSVRASYGAALEVDVYPGQNFAEQLSVASVCSDDNPTMYIHTGTHYFQGVINKPVLLVPVGDSVLIRAN